MEAEEADEQQNEQKRERPEPFDDTDTTPGWLIDYVAEDFPITFFPEQQVEAPLVQDWQGFSFVHPPHAEAQLWVEKAAAEAKKGRFSVLLLPAVFNAVYWRETVYPEATEIRVFTCPVKLPGAKKQVVSQMCLVVFAGRLPEEAAAQYPPVFPVEPTNWQANYYKRKRNLARFATRK